jgi:outer membrane protein assembly factor BamB
MNNHLIITLLLTSTLLTLTATASLTQTHTDQTTPRFTFTPGPDITLTLNTTGTVFAQQLLWTANTTGTNYEESAVTVKDDICYIGSCATHGAGHDTLYALNTTTGTILWSYPTGPGYVGPVLDNDTVYYGTCTHGYHPDDEHLYAFNRYTGELRWTIPIYGGIAESIQMDTHNIYFGTGFENCKIMAINKTTGTITWQYNTTDDVGPNKPMLDGDKLYVAFYNGGGNIYKINTTTGQADWIVPTNGGPWDNSITTDGQGHLFMAIYYASSINCYSTDDGSLIWTRSLHGGPLSFNAYHDGHLFIADTQGYVYSYLALDGSLIWQTKIGDDCDISSPTLSGGLLFIGTRDGSDGAYYALNETTGTILWTYPIGASVTCPPSIAQGTMYCGSDGWNMYAFDFGTGTSDWTLHRYDTHNTAYSPNGLTQWQKVTATCTGNTEDILTCTLTNEYHHPVYDVTLHLPYLANWYTQDGTLLAENTSNCLIPTIDSQQTITLTITKGYLLNISITRPVKGLYFNNIYIKTFRVPLAIGPLTIQVRQQTANMGGITVEFYLDGSLMYTTNGLPANWIWTNRSFGRHTIHVVASQGGLSDTADIDVWKFF